jgi:transposase
MTIGSSYGGATPCLVGMEACATANWAHELTKLGHRVRLMPAKDVKAYVKCNKKRSRRKKPKIRIDAHLPAALPAAPSRTTIPKRPSPSAAALT